jgi:hypothetical protein
MITNFEQITSELTEDEMKLLPILINGFKKHSKPNPIKAPDIVKGMKLYGKFTEVRLRKMVNHIRVNSLLPLIATSSGYYISDDSEEIKLQVKSLWERAKSIKDAADGLVIFIKGEGTTP